MMMADRATRTVTGPGTLILIRMDMGTGGVPQVVANAGAVAGANDAERTADTNFFALQHGV